MPWTGGPGRVDPLVVNLLLDIVDKLLEFHLAKTTKFFDPRLDHL